MKKLPIGISSFKEIIEEDYLYIDKTGIALDLINNNKFVFLSRPRRFGKSLFLDTLKNIFQGNKVLFNNLLIDKQYHWTKHYPVINISFASGVLQSREDLDKAIINRLKDNQDDLNIVINNPDDIANVQRYFSVLIKKTYQHYQQKVVVLVDEYDKPILDNIENTFIAKEMREGLSNFYSVLKGSEEFLKFTFLTGVSKFSKASLFSGLNNMQDISLKPKYATICGYTQQDIDSTFQPYLKNVNKNRLKLWYNGYNFLGDRVYNPFDILLFIDNDQLYKNYWFETGTPSFLIKLIKNNHYYIPAFEYIEIDEKLTSSFDLDFLNLEAIMFQSGYLTIKEQVVNDDFISYRLCFPNKEVKISFHNSVSDLFLNQTITTPLKRDSLEILKLADLNKLESNIKKLFSSIAYNNFTKNDIAHYEGFYASVLYAYFMSLGLDITAEDVTNKGRIDLTIKINNKVYIFEFKVTNGSALEQIKKMNYFEKYQGEIYIIGIVFDVNKRNVSQFEWELVQH